MSDFKIGEAVYHTGRKECVIINGTENAFGKIPVFTRFNEMLNITKSYLRHLDVYEGYYIAEVGDKMVDGYKYYSRNCASIVFSGIKRFIGAEIDSLHASTLIDYVYIFPIFSDGCGSERWAREHAKDREDSVKLAAFANNIAKDIENNKVLAEQKPNIQEKIKELVELIRSNSPENAVGFILFLNSSEYTTEYQYRDAQGLKRDGISMMALNGEFIEG